VIVAGAFPYSLAILGIGKRRIALSQNIRLTRTNTKRPNSGSLIDKLFTGCARLNRGVQ
jgi:hypothetical protein